MDWSKGQERKTFFDELQVKNQSLSKLGPGYYKVKEDNTVKGGAIAGFAAMERFPVHQAEPVTPSSHSKRRRSSSMPRSPFGQKSPRRSPRKTLGEDRIKDTCKNIKQKLEGCVKKLEANHSTRDFLKLENERLQSKVVSLKNSLKKVKEESSLISKEKISLKVEVGELNAKIESLQKQVSPFLIIFFRKFLIKKKR